MKKKFTIVLVTVAVTLVICTIAAMYTPPGFGHSVTMVSTDGGMTRHPVLLGLNKENYVILVTGNVMPPYRGDFRVVLEGATEVKHEILSRYPPGVDLSIYQFHDFTNNTVRNISPKDKFTLIVSIKPEERIVIESDYNLRFYDLESEKPVLSIPIFFTELDNFNISKKVRRPYPDFHETHIAQHPAGKDEACH